jgi:aminopeptidase N
VSDEARYRLPRTVIPRRYDLTLEPDLEAQTFVGTQDVEVEVRETTSEVVLNADELEIVEGGLARGNERIAISGIRLDAEEERAHLTL